jgi:type II secretory pathway pseudopilin PulG
MKYQRNNRSAFTLIEVTLALGVLTFGLTAIVAVYMVSLSWIEEIRVDLTALQTGRMVLADAGVLSDKDDVPSGYSNLDATAKGWVNDYFVVRTVEKPSYPNFDSTVGTYLRVQIQVYFGGTDEDGLLAHDFYCEQIMPSEYK